MLTEGEKRLFFTMMRSPMEYLSIDLHFLTEKRHEKQHGTNTISICCHNRKKGGGETFVLLLAY